MSDYVDWPGASRKTYRYYVHPCDTGFKPTPANYIYSKLNSANEWVPLYIGQTGDLSKRPLDGHHREDCIRREGVTHILVHTSSANEQERLDEETDLRQNFDVVCSRQ